MTNPFINGLIDFSNGANYMVEIILLIIENLIKEIMWIRNFEESHWKAFLKEL